MSLQGQGFEVTGISLFGPKPVDAVHIDLDKGLSVLYGLNGSGKSTVLREAESVLRGIGPQPGQGVASNRSCLHVTITNLQEDPKNFKVSDFEQALVDSLLSVNEEEADFPAHSTRLERWQWLLNEWLGGELDSEWIWNEPVLAGQPAITFSLVPIGTATRPAWGSFVSAHLSKKEWQSLLEHHDVQRRFLSEVAAGLSKTSPLGDEYYESLDKNVLAHFPHSPWNRPVASKGVLERDYLSGWPSNFPIPVATLGHISAPPVHVISDSGSIDSTRDATNSLLIAVVESGGELIDISNDSETEFRPAFSAGVNTLVAQANSFLDLTGPHHFSLSLDLKTPSEWFVGEVPEWIAKVDGTDIFLGRLSGAEQRWALTALQWAISGLDTSRPQVFLMDEPERGLHRMRERELPRMLTNLCRRSENLMVLAASHAPSFLDVRGGVRLSHVSRLRGQFTSLREVKLGTSALTSQTAEALGLNPSDLLQLTTVFVLVEGVHDEIVLNAAIGEDIKRAGGRLIPINGASHARSIADARILFEATDASIVFVLDNVMSGPVLEIWESATALAESGQRKRARSTLGRISSLGRGGELLWLQELGERAFGVNVLHRIKPFGLSKRDIVCYLAPSSFLDTSMSWDELEASYEAARATRSTTLDFKSWLKTMRAADFSRDRVAAASASLSDALPLEFTQLSLTVQTLGLLGAIDPMEAKARL